MIKSLKSYAIFWIAFIICALTFIDGQYSSQTFQCDHNRLQRCQQEISSHIQEVNPQSYTGISSGWQNTGQNDPQSRCSPVRQNLDCLIMYTPVCKGSGISDSLSNSIDLIRRGRQYLERVCEQGSGGWKSSQCYVRSDIRHCESQYNNQVTTSVSSSSCRNFQNFRDCVIQIVRHNCHSQDLQLMGTYLIDKGQELSWSCTLSPDYGYPGRSDTPGPQNQFVTSNDGSNPRGYGNQYGSSGQQQYGHHYGSSGQQYGISGQHGSSGYGGSQGSQYGTQYDGSQSSGSIDRQFGLLPTTDSCIERAGYFVRSCEDTLIQRQRDAREGRSSNDVQRRICCALFFYRDCISRVVVDRCRDPSPIVVDILMGSRKRDLTVTCREYSRDQCSGTSIIKASISVFFSIFLSIWFFKSNV